MPRRTAAELVSHKRKSDIAAWERVRDLYRADEENDSLDCSLSDSDDQDIATYSSSKSVKVEGKSGGLKLKHVRDIDQLNGGRYNTVSLLIVWLSCSLTMCNGMSHGLMNSRKGKLLQVCPSLSIDCRLTLFLLLIGKALDTIMEGIGLLSTGTCIIYMIYLLLVLIQLFL